MIRIRPHNVRKAPVRQLIALRTVLPVVAAMGFIPTASAASTAHLSWYPRDLLTDEEQDALPDFCHGNYRVADFEPIEGQQIEVEADQSLVSKSGDTQLQGDVVMRQADRQVTADTAYWYQQRGFAEFRGNVTLQSPDITLHGDSADFDQSGGQLIFNQAEYSVPQRHFRGSAASIDSSEEGRIDLADATFTFCEPGHNDWDLKASELHLDQEAGIGSAWHARLRVKEVPVMYVPYYRFPIGDQRMTGFLDPSFSLNGMGQAEDVQIPFYWNIAANADATLIAHHILDRGVLWESQLRHKTALLGDGELNYGYLADDETEGEERWLINYQQNGTIGAGWSHSWVYNHISDNDYLSDMNPQAAVDRTTHLPRRGQIQWNGGYWYFDVIGESFQTIDDTIALSSRPYRRLPQMNLNFSQSAINDWQFSQKLQVTRFNRDAEATIADSKQILSGFAALNGDRLLSDSSVAYPFEWPFGFLTPKIEYRYRAYHLTDDDDAVSDDVDLDVSHGTGKYSVDGGLYFDREFSWFGNDYQQTLEPRIFWVRSPYLKDQNLIPNFDSARTTVTYASLFTGDRFTGGDRLADLDQVSTGLTTRFIRGDGLEQFRASIGRIWYNEDRLVQLSGTSLPEADTQSISSTLGEVEFNPDLNWSLYHTIEWDEYKDFARQRRYGVRYESTQNRFLNLATNTVQSWNSGTEKVVTTTRQIDAGFFWSLNDRWAMVGRMLRDMRSYDKDEKRPLSPVLESLAGFEYQNCCWRVQLLYRETSPQDTSADAEFTTDKRYGFLLSIQLKGLSTFGSGTDDVISEGITGYSRRQYHDY